jgi:hypothetical protein
MQDIENPQHRAILRRIARLAMLDRGIADVERGYLDFKKAPDGRNLGHRR